MNGGHDTSEASEYALLKKVKVGDKAAFDKVVSPLLPQLLALSRRMLGSVSEAEDAVQNALASVWLARSKLDPRRPVAAYLTTVTLNKSRDALRRRKLIRFIGIGGSDAELSIADEDPDAATLVADRQVLSIVQQAIDRLPLRLRESLVLVTIEGRSQREVADLLGVSEKTVETRVYRARRRLEDHLKKFEG